MYNGNSRLNDLGSGIITEQVSVQTQLFYDPTTQSCRAIFNGSPFMAIPQAEGGVKYVSVGADNDILPVELNAKMTDIICGPEDFDPVTGAPLDQISVLGILTYMKRAYNKFHNENYAAIQAMIAAAEAAAAAAQAEAEAAAAAAAAAAEQEPPAEEPPPEEPTP